MVVSRMCSMISHKLTSHASVLMIEIVNFSLVTNEVVLIALMLKMEWRKSASRNLVTIRQLEPSREASRRMIKTRTSQVCTIGASMASTKKARKFKKITSSVHHGTGICTFSMITILRQEKELSATKLKVATITAD